MSNVVLLAINAKYVHSSLSVWVIAEGINRYSRISHDVNVVEATINQKIEDIVDGILQYNPDVIGISTYIWNAAMLCELCLQLRERLPGVVIVMGGPEASNNIDYWLENGADYVLDGEGEYTLPPFLDSLEDDSSFINGDCSADIPVDPYTDDYFKSLGGRLSYIETSRGCPFKCAFCLSAGSSVKYFPLDTVKEQIYKLSQANTKTIKFVDRTFNCNAKRAYEIFEYVISLDTVCVFHFEVAADLFDERTLLLLETAPTGRIQFEIGLQSFFMPALKAVSRQTDLIKAEKNILFLVNAQNIHIHIDLIAGLPYETISDFENGFNYAYSLNTHTLQLGFLKLLHGSELRKQSESLGIHFNTVAPYEILFSPWLSGGDISILKKIENALQHTRNKNRFISTLHYVQAVTGKSPFSLMHSLGSAAFNRGTQLEDYIVQVYDFFKGLPGVVEHELKDCMIYDWLGMVKGKNTPAFLKNDDKQRIKIQETAEKTLGRKLRREEYAILNSGIGIFVDSNNRNPVSELYRVYICDV